MMHRVRETWRNYETIITYAAITIVADEQTMVKAVAIGYEIDESIEEKQEG